MDSVEFHRKAAVYLDEAAKNHREAAKHHEAGNPEKAHHNAVKAHGDILLALETENNCFKNHALSR